MNNTEKLDVVKKIIDAKVFGNSDTYGNLLKFLVECSFDAYVPKEADIALTIFGKENFDSVQNPMVRVYVYKLRKKLASYYATKGLKDPIKLSIPKGGYAVVFEDNKKENNKKMGRKVLIFSSLFILLSFFGLWNWKVHSGPGALQNNILLNEIFSARGDKATLVLGDFFLWTEYDPKLPRKRVLRSDNVKNRRDFEFYISKYGDSTIKYNQFPQTSIPFRSSLWTNRVSTAFGKVNKEFQIRPMSNLDPETLKNKEILAIGSLNNLSLFSTVGVHYKFQYEDKPSIQYTDPQNKSTTIYDPSVNKNREVTDYCLVTKTMGPYSKPLLVFGGLWNFGIDTSLAYFTDPEKGNELSKALNASQNELPEFYEMLIEVKAIENAVISTRIVGLHALDSIQASWKL